MVFYNHDFFFWIMSFFFQKRHGWKIFQNFHEHYISVGDVMVTNHDPKFHRANNFLQIFAKNVMVGLKFVELSLISRFYQP